MCTLARKRHPPKKQQKKTPKMYFCLPDCDGSTVIKCLNFPHALFQSRPNISKAD